MFNDIEKGIYWDACWNFITGCSKTSPACENCYAEKLATTRFKGRFGYPADDPFRVTYHPDKMEQPLHWKNPRAIFTCNMGDLFHEDVPDEIILKAVQIMQATPQHIYIILTKRAERLSKFRPNIMEHPAKWPDNAWVGVTAENQEQANKRVPHLMQTWAKTKFLSIEPMLGRIYLDQWWEWIDWIIVGGESGRKARPTDTRWVRDIRNQCIKYNIPFLFKQWGELKPKNQEHDNDYLLCAAGYEIETPYGPFYRQGNLSGRELDGRTWIETPLTTLCRPKAHAWEVLNKTTPSGKQLFGCSACGAESVGPGNVTFDPCPVLSQGAQPILLKYKEKNE